MNKKEQILSHTQRVCSIAAQKARLTYQDAERRQKAISLHKEIEKEEIQISEMFGGEFSYFFWRVGNRSSSRHRSLLHLP